MATEYSPKTECFSLLIKGLVQGVGFRPFVYRIAKEMKLSGRVENRNDGVYIKVNGTQSEINRFEHNLKRFAPHASQIESISKERLNGELFNDFQIIKSNNISQEVTQVSPDIAFCDDCIDDLHSQPHRINYPFTNCTNCGPRFSIIKKLPYDRPYTTMHSFTMCDACKKEYSDVFDRRFHAQPIACNNCGPEYQLFTEQKVTTDINAILKKVSNDLSNGKIYAIKGIGGFHLMCDAKNEEGVAKIREIKNRDGKPFAVMASSVQAVEKVASCNEIEKKLLHSWRRPIVLLLYKKGLANGVTNGLNKVGIMLPYMLFHQLLFEKLTIDFIVLTSGNISDEPIIIDNQKAISVFETMVDGIITYNRDIHNRVDDSVTTVMNNTERVLRRSRGYAPQPVITDLNLEGIFSAGAELSNSFCIGKGNQAILSQYQGDLKNAETFEFFEETYQRFEALFKFKPTLIVSDLHPDYLSSQYAQELAKKYQIPLIKVQHHHAHIASVMATNKLDENVIGISMDGTGLGTDRNIWGAEFMRANLADFDRLFHFEYIPLPGGDKASKEPWRMALSYLYESYGEEIYHLNLPVLETIDHLKIKNTIQMIKNKRNIPLASSAGRLFDAVASIIGMVHYNTYQAEGPMRLESIIKKTSDESYSYNIDGHKISFKKMIREIVNDYLNKISKHDIALKFHNTIIKLIIEITEKISTEKNINKIILCGGTFQNAYLTENVENKLKSRGYKVYTPKNVPVNDQGVALGQTAVAAKRRLLNI